MKTRPYSTVETFKHFIRQPYSWPGGYPQYLVMSDGEAICKCCAKTEYRLILASTRDNDKSGWNTIGVDVNWEDQNLTCGNCDSPIEAAYEADSEVDE